MHELPTTTSTTMDDQVAAAMSRWPDVPSAYGWLSLNQLGQWRLHPQGDGWAVTCEGVPLPGTNTGLPPGEAITSSRILAFINRNYTHDAQGRWYFQNGPQRVFVRLDAAPLILSLTGPGPTLQTHTGLDVEQVHAWWVDDEGRLYADTEHGPGLVAGRDAMAVFDALRATDGRAVLELLEQGEPDSPVMIAAYGTQAAHPAKPAPLAFRPAQDIPRILAFSRFPIADGE